MNDYKIKTFFSSHYMMFDLKGHIRSNKALYVYIFSSNSSSIKPLLSLYSSTFSHSLVLLLSFPPTPLPSTPLNWCNNHPIAAADKKKIRGTLAHRLSPPLSFSFSLCLSISHSSSLFLFFPSPLTSTLALYPTYASLSFLSLLFFSSLSLFSIHPPPTPTLALYPPYASPSFLSHSFFFSLFLTLTYVLMDNFLSLFS